MHFPHPSQNQYHKVLLLFLSHPVLPSSVEQFSVLVILSFKDAFKCPSCSQMHGIPKISVLPFLVCWVILGILCCPSFCESNLSIVCYISASFPAATMHFACFFFIQYCCFDLLLFWFCHYLQKCLFSFIASATSSFHNQDIFFLSVLFHTVFPSPIYLYSFHPMFPLNVNLHAPPLFLFFPQFFMLQLLQFGLSFSLTF